MYPLTAPVSTKTGMTGVDLGVGCETVPTLFQQVTQVEAGVGFIER
jgi:hypothetical protein